MDATPHFSDDAQKAIAASRDHAIQLGNNFIGPEHLVLGMIGLGAGKACEILSTLTDVSKLSDEITSDMRGRSVDMPDAPPGLDVEPGSLMLTPDAEAIIHESMVSSTSTIIGGEHILSTMLRMNNGARTTLNGAGITTESVQNLLN